MNQGLTNINGQIFPPDQARISVFDRGFLYGDSIYEVTRTIKRVPFLLDDHLRRLWLSAEKLDIPMSHSMDYIREQIQETIAALNIDDVYLRIIITRGLGEIGLNPALSQGNNLIIIALPLPEFHSWWYSQGVHIIVADTIRNLKCTVDPSIKSGNYLNNVLAYSEASKQGAFDAIMLNNEGHVTEATTSNVWIVKSGILMTPPLEAGLLEGITRGKLLEIAKLYGLPAIEKNFNADELRAADECFLSATIKQLIPVTKIDHRPLGNGHVGPVSQKLLKLYREHFHIAES